MILEAYCDGSITGSHWGKKGEKDTVPHGWSGWVVRRESDGVVVHHHSIDLGAKPYMTGNIAEYMALRSVLKWLGDNHPKFHVVVYSDSQLVINQMSGKYNCYQENLVPLRDHCRDLARKLLSVRYEWIRREQNKYADYMSKVFQHLDAIPEVPIPAHVLLAWK